MLSKPLGSLGEGVLTLVSRDDSQSTCIDSETSTEQLIPEDIGKTAIQGRSNFHFCHLCHWCMTLNELVMESGYRFPYKGLLTPRKLENGHRNRVAEELDISMAFLPQRTCFYLSDLFQMDLVFEI